MGVLKTFGISVLMAIALDYIWLGFVMKKFNLDQLKDIGRISNGEFDVWLPPAIATYVLMAALITFFLAPIVEDKSLLATFGMGCLLGFCVYGVFDLTNAAILKNYPLPFAAADIAWGTVLFGIIGTVATRQY